MSAQNEKHDLEEARLMLKRGHPIPQCIFKLIVLEESKKQKLN